MLLLVYLSPSKDEEKLRGKQENMVFCFKIGLVNGKKNQYKSPL